jgi:hypothetical protein
MMFLHESIQEVIYDLRHAPDVRLRFCVYAHSLCLRIPIQPLGERRVPFVQFFLDPSLRVVVRFKPQAWSQALKDRPLF